MIKLDMIYVLVPNKPLDPDNIIQMKKYKIKL